MLAGVSPRAFVSDDSIPAAAAMQSLLPSTQADVVTALQERSNPEPIEVREDSKHVEVIREVPIEATKEVPIVKEIVREVPQLREWTTERRVENGEELVAYEIRETVRLE